MGATLLRTEGLGKRFGVFDAVKNLDLRIQEGAIHGLIGPNGAGKTTSFHLITRVLRPSQGKIFFEDQRIDTLSTHAIARRGLLRSFQVTAVFGDLSVRENFQVALMRAAGHHRKFFADRGLLRSFDEEIDVQLKELEIEALGEKAASSLSYGERRVVELGMLALLRPKLLLLDEPSSGIGAAEIPRLVKLIQRLAKGRTALIVEHNLDLIAQLCSRISVLKEGQLLAEGSFAELKKNIRVQEAYLGKESL